MRKPFMQNFLWNSQWTMLTNLKQAQLCQNTNKLQTNCVNSGWCQLCKCRVLKPERAVFDKHIPENEEEEEKNPYQNACPQIQLTRLQPPFFSTGLWHFGQGFVWTVIQLTVSDSSRHFLAQRSHIKHEQGECASDKQLKQNCMPQAHSTSQNSSSSTRIAFPQWGVLGHHLTILLSSI